ncbi:MAG: helix-turn-helix domain-containing protein, partial [Clostridiales bacterium]|nr:helix-turn-helix domain-containing protein [Clostridiales bacterium]
MDGISLVRSAREFSRDMSFLIISGFAEFEYAKEALELGVAGYVLKPIKNDELARAVRTACAEVDARRSATMERRISHLMEKENLSLFAEKSLNAILSGQEQYNNVCGKVFERLPELKNSFCMLAIFHIDHPKTYSSSFSENDFDLLRFSVKNVLEEVCCDKALCFSSYKDKTSLFVVCYGQKQCQVALDSSNFISDIYLKLCRTASISVTVGTSDVHKDLSSLPKCYEEANHALDRRYVNGSGKLYRYAEMKVLVKSEFHFPEHKLQTLKIFLESLDYSKGTAGVEKIIEDIFSVKYLEFVTSAHLKMLFVETARIVIRFCEHMGLDIFSFIDESEASGESLADYGNVLDMGQFFIDLIKNIVAANKFGSNDIKILIHRVENYICNNFHTNIQLDVVALKFGLNSKYLSRVFKCLTGSNFCDYLSDIRLQKAKELLKNTQMMIQDIALNVGYNDHQYFHRVFKKYCGVTPNEFRVQNT